MPVVDDKKIYPMIIDDMDENKAKNLVLNRDAFLRPLVAEKGARYKKEKDKEAALALKLIYDLLHYFPKY